MTTGEKKLLSDLIQCGVQALIGEVGDRCFFDLLKSDPVFENLYKGIT